jgi:hypothetical protein
MITTWYLHSYLTWDWLCHSCISSYFLPHGAFPEGGAYAFLGGMHAGPLEALRVTRPKAVDLERIKDIYQCTFIWARNPRPLGYNERTEGRRTMKDDHRWHHRFHATRKMREILTRRYPDRVVEPGPAPDTLQIDFGPGSYLLRQ